jgi:hypothetical protein
MCCLQPINKPTAEDPCDYCTSVYGSCPPTCSNAPVIPDPCDACNDRNPYSWCPSECNGTGNNANSGYQSGRYFYGY